MSDETTPQYFCLVTAEGAALDARARVSGLPLRLTHIGVGDASDGAGYTTPVPDAAATRLRHECCRLPVERIFVDDDNPCLFWLEATIPADVGGWWITEVGVYAREGGADEEHPDNDDGCVLFAVGNHAPYYKVRATDGIAVEHTVRVPVTVSSASVVSLEIDSAVFVTREEFEAALARLENGPLGNVIAGLQREVAVLAHRLFLHELAGRSGGSVMPFLTPSGVPWAEGARVAPLTLLQNGADVPGAAFKICLMDFPAGAAENNGTKSEETL